MLKTERENKSMVEPIFNDHHLKNSRPFSIVIPAFNEADAILPILDTVCAAVSKLEHEIIVVDDGSTDNTIERLKAYPVILIRHPYNRGYGAALKTGIQHAKYDLICTIDADGTYPGEKIPHLVRTLIEGDFDMVVGARNGKNISIPLVRRPAKWFLNKLANYLCDIKIPDLNSGLRVMKKEIIERFIHILPDGFSFTTTITLAMLTNGYSIKYISIDYFKRSGKSKIRPIKDTFNFLQLVIKTVLYFNPLKIFIPFSVSLVIFAFLVLFGSWFFLGDAVDVTFGVILMTAVMCMAIGMLADLIDKRMR
jgi:glycosyltransferase involved in cell wall biosynthesis